MPEIHFDWERLAQDVHRNGIRNSLLIAIAPTATIASIVGSYESIEPQVSNMFKRETLSGEFLQVNRYLIADLKRAGLGSRRSARRSSRTMDRSSTSRRFPARSASSIVPLGRFRKRN